MTIYALRPMPWGSVEVAKFDDHENLPLAVYTVKKNQCDCAAHIPWCRHKAMIRYVQDAGVPLEGALVDWDRRVIRRMPEPLLITRDGRTHVREGVLHDVYV